MSGTLSNRQVRRIAAAAGLGAGATLAWAGAAQASTFTVGTTADTALGGDCLNTTNTDCTLRDSINDANATVGVNDIITFKAGVTGSITLGSDLPQITDPVAIEGPGTAIITVAGNAHRIFDAKPATPGDSVFISDLTLSGGNPNTSLHASGGGAIMNEDADLTLQNSILTGNTASGYGAAIYSGCDVACGAATHGDGYAASLTVEGSTLSGNTSTNNGGGAIYLNYGTGLIVESTITGNTAQWGGGVGMFYLQGGARIRNTTIAGNTAVNGGGGGVYAFYSPGGVTIASSTVAGNGGTSGGGVYFGNGDPTLSRPGPNLSPVIANSIVADNTATTAGPDLFTANGGAFGSAFSLLETTSGATVSETVASSNIGGVDPQLGSLQNNGGRTQTMAPAATSPVIDCGSDTANTFDQRETGFPRLVDQPNRIDSSVAGANKADMGAVELASEPLITGACTNNPPLPTPSSSPPATTTPTAPPVSPPATTKKKKCKKKKRSSAQIAKKCKKKPK